MIRRLQFLLGAGQRWRWALIFAPAVGAILIGLFAMPDSLAMLLGLAAGWLLAGLFLFRRGAAEYRLAIKLLRQNRQEEAIQEMDALIQRDSDCPEHYHLRAEILRVGGQLERAQADYQRMTQLAPDSATAFNGLSEVEFQSGHYDQAQAAALKALELAPRDWVALYNLGMIEDRLKQSEAVIEYLTAALKLKIADPRHRLLAYLYLTRAYARLGNGDAARETVAALKEQRAGLRDWQILLQSESAETLRAMLGGDVQTAQHLADGEMMVEALANA